MNTQQKTDYLIKLYGETATIESQMPIIIDGFEIAELMLRCNGCLQSLKQELIHGYATKPLPNTASFHAVGVCHECRSITESVQRVKMLGKHKVRFERLSKSGKWECNEQSTKPESRIITLLKRIIGYKIA